LQLVPITHNTFGDGFEAIFLFNHQSELLIGDAWCCTMPGATANPQNTTPAAEYKNGFYCFSQV